jgi:arylsulfatase A-like enzyme
MAVHNYVTTRRQRKFESKGQTPISKTAHFGRNLVRKFGQKYHEQAIDNYDNTILFTDRLVQNLTNFIRKNHPDTLIIITSDHGEEFLDHGGYLHARTLYNELLRVPLLLLGPAIPRGRSTSRLTDHADLFATVLDYLDLPLPATQGESLLRRQTEDAEPIYAEKRNGGFAQRALISKEGKFIEQKPRGQPRTKPSMEGEGTWEFYRDPVGLDDRNTLDELAPAAIAEARAQFERIWAENQKIQQDQTRGYKTQRDMTDEEAEALRDLGYVE